jgi:hypothetical protein
VVLKTPANGPKTARTPADKTINSKYFVTKYPGRYRLRTVPFGQSASLAAWQLTAPQEPGVGQSTTISIVIENLSAGGVQQSSTYKLFTSRPGIYKLSSGTYDNEPVIIAKQTEPTFQQTILWPHGSTLLSVSLTAGSETDVTGQEIQTVLQNLRWQ